MNKSQNVFKSIFFLITFTTALSLSAFAQLSGDVEPAFDCEKAGPPIEETICHDPPWLAAHDAVMGRLYRHLRKTRVRRIRAAQSSCLRKRNLCGDDYNCIEKRYVERLVVLARTAGDRTAITGSYKYSSGDKDLENTETNHGEMLIVREPDGTISGRITTTSGLSSHDCTVGFRRGKKDEITITSTAECRPYCGSAGYFDTNYQKLP